MPMTIMEPAPSASRKLTYKEFLARCDENNAAEWVNGKVIPMTVSVDHNNLSLFLSKMLSEFVMHTNAGEVFVEPFQMKTGPNLPGRSPDVCFLAKEHLTRLQKNHIEGPADIVIEIVSPESVARDRAEKYLEYEQGGVREYWIIDPLRKQADFYVRGEDGYFHSIYPDANNRYRSATLEGLWVDAAWFWKSPLPSLWTVLKAWQLI